MVLKRRRFTRKFKLQVVREVESGKSVAQVAREYQLHPTMINRWHREHERDVDQAFSGNGKSLKSETRAAELESMVGQLTLAVPCLGVATASPTGRPMENALLKKSVTTIRKSITNGRQGWSALVDELISQ